MEYEVELTYCVAKTYYVEADNKEEAEEKAEELSCEGKDPDFERLYEEETIIKEVKQ